MKRPIAALLLGLFLLTLPAGAVSLTLDGAPLSLPGARVRDGVTYVPLRGLMEAAWPGAAVTWEDGRAVVRRGGDTLTAVPGEAALTLNGAAVDTGRPVLLENGRTLVPLRPLCALLGVRVDWSPKTGVVQLSRGGAVYDEEDIYWLARIISAESRGECRAGKIAVGNVVLNRVRSPDFPNTIYGVIFDPRWGGQFEPVRNGTVYDPPTDESLEAALACLAGENTVGGSLYFLAPALTSDHWIMKNRDYVTTIGTHWFYR